MPVAGACGEWDMARGALHLATALSYLFIDLAALCTPTRTICALWSNCPHHVIYGF